MATVKVAFIDHAEQLGGAQKSLIELLGNLDRDRVEPVLMCTQGARWTERDELAGVPTAPVFRPHPVLAQRRSDVQVSALRAGRSAVQSMRPVYDLARALVRYRIDIAHTNTLKTHVIGAAARRLTRASLVWHVRDILEPGPALTWLARAARLGRPQIIAISHAVAHQFEEFGLGSTVIHNGIPLDLFTPDGDAARVRAELELSHDDQVVCVVGRLTPWKGHRTLLCAMADVIEACPNARLLVVGEVAFWEDDYERQLKDFARKQGVTRHVRWLGFRDDIPDILRASDLFVLPSRDEPFGRAIIEAMATGKPVIACRSGGVPEIVEDGVSGLLVQPEDAPALSQAIIRLLTDGKLRLRMSQQALQRARERFGAARVAQMVQEVYFRRA